MIQTSITIGTEHKKALLLAAESLEISVNELITLLLQKSGTLFDDQAILFRTVRYQRFHGEIPNILHIQIPEVEYEYAVAKRYLFKISVSFIVRLALDFLLPEMLKSRYESIRRKPNNYVTTNFFTDTYIFREYSVDHSYSKKMEHWKLNWER